MHMPVPLCLRKDRHPEETPAAALVATALVCVLAFQAHAEELCAIDSTLINAQTQIALPSIEGWRHDLLRLDHIPEEPKVADLHRKWSSKYID